MPPQAARPGQRSENAPVFAGSIIYDLPANDNTAAGSFGLQPPRPNNSDGKYRKSLNLFGSGFSGSGKRKTPGQKSGSLSVHLDRSGDLTGTHTPGTNINMAGGTVHDCLHTLHIGLPCTIGTPMRVGDLNTERYALVAELALCHPLHLLAVA